MKKFGLFYGILMTLEFAAFGQDAVVSSSWMNTLYLGIGNPVEIAVSGITSDKITATVNNGTISRTDKGWEILPQNMELCIVTVFADNKKIADKTFKVKPVPVPYALFAGTYAGEISKENARIGHLEARVKDLEFDIEYRIVSFTMLTKSGSELYAKGSLLTNEMKSQISGLIRGNSLTFKDIKAIGPDGNIKNLSPVILQIK